MTPKLLALIWAGIAAIVFYNVAPGLATGFGIAIIVIALFAFGANLISSPSNLVSTLGVVLFLGAFAAAALIFGVLKCC